MHVRGDLIIEGYFDTERIGEIERIIAGDGDLPQEQREPETVLCAGGKTVPLPDAHHICDRRYFGKTLISYRTFEAVVDMSKLSENSEIYFADADSGAGTGHGADGSAGGADAIGGAGLASVQDRRRIVFSEPESGISPALGCLYKSFGDFALEYDPEKNAIIACRPSLSRRLRNESRAFRCIMNTKLPLRKKIAESALRAGCLLTRWYYCPLRIRLYYDRARMGGDNGQYQFVYGSDRCRAEGGPSTRHRYVVSRESMPYFDLRREGYKVHSYESPFKKLVALHAEIILATHGDVKSFFEFDSFERRWLADLFTAHIVYLQHGLTVEDVSRRRARYFDNTELYFCAAETEAENLSRTEYGYRPEALRLTGLPRYDGLVSDPDPIVLVAPTYRRGADSYADDDASVGANSRAGGEKGEGQGFVAEYREVYRSLLTNEKLLAALDERGYILQFLPHPAQAHMIDDFADCASETVEIVDVSKRGYEQFLKQAAVLITDYSGVQFDFAYMEKPVIYYQPPSLPPDRYGAFGGAGGFDYEACGFGAVAADADALVSELARAIDENVRWSGGAEPLDILPDEVYLERMRGFFVHHDRENRVRIYDVIESEYGV
jgi:CDP-glycerol glycerophosphotransferase (TagB/SpsB family)